MDEKNTINTEIQDKNMFTDILGEKYAKKFSEVFDAAIKDQDKLMTDLYNESKEDPDLTKKQKKTIYGCTIAYNIAQAEKGVTAPLIAFVSNHKPNLTKAVTGKKFKRYKRTIEDLYTFGQRTGFFVNIAELPTLIKRIERTFGFRKKEDINKSPQEIMEDLEYEVMYIAAISKFARIISLSDIIAHWYVVILLKQIINLPFISPKLAKEMPGLNNQVKNLLKAMNYIHYLEVKRANDAKPKTEEEIKAKEMEDKEYEEMIDREADTVLHDTTSFNDTNKEANIYEKDIPKEVEEIEV